VALEKESCSTILVTLAGAAVSVDCSDPVLHERFATLFRHCSYPPCTPRIRFSVTRTSKKEHRLEREGRQLYEGDNLDYLSHLLIHELMICLIRDCVDGLALHSGALARSGSGLLLCGESASGKSTLSAWLTAAGFDYLTDEHAVVALDGRSMTGLPRAIMLRQGSTFVLEHWLGKDHRRSSISFASKSIAVDPELLRPASVCRRARPKALFFPRYSPGEPLASRRLSAAEATVRLVRVSTNAAKLPESGIPAALALARGVEAFTLDYPDAATAAAWIESKVAG